MNFNNQQMNSITVTKLLLQETGTYNPIYSRPYQTVLTPYDLESISKRVDESRGATISGSLLAGIASSVISQSASPVSEIQIPYGWSERRVRFILEVQVTTNTGNSFIYYFQGFTSHLGIGQNGSVDPTMEFHINSFIRVNRFAKQTPMGIVMQDVVSESAHVLNGNIHYANSNDKYMMRPQDIFTGIQSSYLDQAYNSNGKNTFTDTRITLSTEPVRSNRNNNLPSNYLAKIIDSYQTGTKLAEFGQSEEDIISRSRDLTYESSVFENVFIRALSNVKGYSGSVSFTFPELMKIDPNVSAVTNYISLGTTQSKQLHAAGQTAYWNSSDRETLVASILSNAIPALMMELMISKIYFRSTNSDIGGNMNTIIIDAKSLTNADLTANYELFKRRLEKEILFDITYGNQSMFMIDMSADLFGETSISVSMDGAPMTPYTTPSFCDSLMVPVLSPSKDSYFNVVNDLEILMNNIKDSRNTSMAVNNFV